MRWTLRRALVRIALALPLLGATLWGAGAIFYCAPLGDQGKAFLSGGFALLGVGAVIAAFWRRARPLMLAFLAAFIVVLAGWLRIQPSNDRDWQPDVAVLPYAEIDGDRVTMRNIRNFDYRSETDFTPRYYDKSFDLRELESADLVATYWMGDAIAHMMVSFGFAGRDYLAISIETRKEKSEAYSTLAGFFKQYELIYIVADERDVIRLRTNYRNDPPEQVYVYRTRSTPEGVRRVFLSYLAEINSLKERAEFYNTLTTNCTTNIWMHTKVNAAALGFSWKILASGYVPQLAYEHGRLDTRLPFEELRRRAHVNPAARAAADAADFSQRIRATIPMP